MPRVIKSVIAQEEAITASTTVTYDLPVNPLSFLTMALRWQDGAVIGNAGDPIADALSFITRIEVLFKGQAIIAGSGADLFYMSHFLTGKSPTIMNLVDAAAERHYLAWLISFSRVPYWEKECFPSVRRGELQLQITYAAAVGTVDTPALLLESTELLDTTPEQYLKYTTISKTPSAAGEHDVDLPIGNPLLGILAFATTVPTGVVTNRDIGEARLLLDNKEEFYAKTNWEALWAESVMRAPMNEMIDRHTHMMEPVAGTFTGQQLLGIIGRNRYAYFDFDPLKDDRYMIDTAGHARVHLRINSEGSNGAIRLMPIELIKIAGG